MKIFDHETVQFSNIAGARNCMDFCVECPHYPAKRPVPGSGSSKAQIVFVGEQPGEEEDALGYPFIGPAGERLTILLDELGLKRKDVFISNVTKCMALQKNRQHPKAVVRHCVGNWLWNELIEIEPAYVVALGEVAYKWIKAEMGLFCPIEFELIKFPHPASALRRPIQEAKLRVATDMFKEMINATFNSN